MSKNELRTPSTAQDSELRKFQCDPETNFRKRSSWKLERKGRNNIARTFVPGHRIKIANSPLGWLKNNHLNVTFITLIVEKRRENDFSRSEIEVKIISPKIMYQPSLQIRKENDYQPNSPKEESVLALPPKDYDKNSYLTKRLWIIWTFGGIANYELWILAEKQKELQTKYQPELRKNHLKYFSKLS